MPSSVLCLKVDKGQGPRSGIRRPVEKLSLWKSSVWSTSTVDDRHQAALFITPGIKNMLHLRTEPRCSGVDFIKVGRKAQIIEIALSKLGARRKARPTPLKSFSKVGRRARNSL